MKKQPWYPLNVQELCIRSSRMKELGCFWNIYVSDQSFPNSKRLKITNDMNGSNYKVFIDANSDTRDRMSSLIENGLQLLHFELKYYKYCDFIPGLFKDGDVAFDPCEIVKFLKNVVDCIYTYGGTSIINPFVLKLEFYVEQIGKKKMKNKLRSKQLTHVNKDCMSSRIII